MNIYIPKPVSFEVPEGAYRGVLRDVIELNGKLKNCKNQIRLTFDITYPAQKGCQYRVGKNYCGDADASDELISDLKTWLENELIDMQGENGSFDLEQLKNREADLAIAHIINTKHATPYVYIEGIFPPGSLLKMGGVRKALPRD